MKKLDIIIDRSAVITDSKNWTSDYANVLKKSCLKEALPIAEAWENETGYALASLYRVRNRISNKFGIEGIAQLEVVDAEIKKLEKSNEEAKRVEQVIRYALAGLKLN